MRWREAGAVGLVLWSVAGCAPRRGVELPAPASPDHATGPVPATHPSTRKAARPAARRRPAHTTKGPSHADSIRLELALFRERAHAPLTRILRRRSGNDAIAERAAEVLLREARRLRLSPSFAAAVLLVENTPMDTAAVSNAGAIGLMQVMPVHEGSFGCGSELQELEANICYGVHLLRMSLRRHRTVAGALRWYNGCVGRRVTRSCRRYPARVLRTASSIRHELLRLPPEPASPPDSPPDTAPPPPYYLRRTSDHPDSAATPVRPVEWLGPLLGFPADSSAMPDD